MFVKFSSVRLKTVSAGRVDAHSGDVRDSCSLNLTDRDCEGACHGDVEMRDGLESAT